MGIYVSEVVWWNVRPLTFMMWGGVFERFPRLKVAITEGTDGLGARVPARCSTSATQRRTTRRSSATTAATCRCKPSEYFARNVLLGASCMPRREAELRHEIGRREHHVGQRLSRTPKARWPVTREQMTETFRGLPERRDRRDARRQRRRVYGFDVEKLAPLVARIGPEKRAFLLRRAPR